MSKSKKILIILILIIVVAGIIAIIFLSKNKQTQQTTTSTTISISQIPSEVQKLALNFTKEFFTYKVSDPKDYQNRLKPFIADVYWQKFSDLYASGSSQTIPQNQLNNWSKATNVQIKEAKPFEKNAYTIVITANIDKVDTQIQSDQFQDQQAVMVIISQINGAWKITNFTFATI